MLETRVVVFGIRACGCTKMAADSFQIQVATWGMTSLPEACGEMDMPRTTSGEQMSVSR